MQEDDLNLPEEELEHPEEKTDVTHQDPFDLIEDPDTLRSAIIKYPSFDITKLNDLVGKSVEELRAEAKKIRSIDQRKAKKPEVVAPKKTDVRESIPDTDVVRKSDMAKIATRKAKEMLPEEVVAVYDELLKINLGGFDYLDENSIAANLKERYTLFKSRNPDVETAPDTTSLTETRATGTGSKPKDGGIKTTSTLNIPESKKPEDWYPKKS